MSKTIIENGIRVYKNHFCHCPCKQRIPYPNNKEGLRNHIRFGIPLYIHGHHKQKSKNFKKLNEILLEPTVIEDGVKYYKNHYCKCKCGERIQFPIDKGRLFNHVYTGIPEYCHGHDFKNKHHTKESKDKISNALIGVSRKPFTEETLLKMSKAQSGKYVSTETCEKIRIARSGKNCHWYGRPPPENSSHGKGCHYNSPLQGRIWLRSSYELAYAQYLDNKNVKWKYEHKTFRLSNGTTYTPDFYLTKNKKYREIKGYMFPEAQKKVELFQQEYNKNFKILYKEDLIKKGIII